MPRRYWRVRIRDHRDEYDAVIIGNIRGSDVANPMHAPYLGPDEPTGQGCEVDLLTGRTTVGATTIHLVDAVAVVADDPVVLTDGFDPADDSPLLERWAITGDQLAMGIQNHTDPVPPAPKEVSPHGGAPGLVQLRSTTDHTIGDEKTALAQTLSGLTPGASYTVTIWTQGWGNLSSESMGLRLNGATVHGAGAAYAQGAFYGIDWSPLTATATATAAGEILIEFGVMLRVPQTPPATQVPLRYWWFSDLSVARTLVAHADGTVTPPTTVTGRVLTAALSDAQARQHLLSRKVIVEMSADEVP